MFLNNKIQSNIAKYRNKKILLQIKSKKILLHIKNKIQRNLCFLLNRNPKIQKKEINKYKELEIHS